MDITTILTCVIRLLTAIAITFVIPLIAEKRKNEKVAHALQIAEEVGKIAYSVAAAANEYDITGELIKIGKTKAEYALELAKKELSDKGIVYDEELLIKDIKAAVTKLRVNITNTTAEKIKSE
jgi:hypothetical protein